MLIIEKLLFFFDIEHTTMHGDMIPCIPIAENALNVCSKRNVPMIVFDKRNFIISFLHKKMIHFSKQKRGIRVQKLLKECVMIVT